MNDMIYAWQCLYNCICIKPFWGAYLNWNPSSYSETLYFEYPQRRVVRGPCLVLCPAPCSALLSTFLLFLPCDPWPVCPAASPKLQEAVPVTSSSALRSGYQRGPRLTPQSPWFVLIPALLWDPCQNENNSWEPLKKAPIFAFRV